MSSLVTDGIRWNKRWVYIELKSLLVAVACAAGVTPALGGGLACSSAHLCLLTLEKGGWSDDNSSFFKTCPNVLFLGIVSRLVEGVLFLWLNVSSVVVACLCKTVLFKAAHLALAAPIHLRLVPKCFPFTSSSGSQLLAIAPWLSLVREGRKGNSMWCFCCWKSPLQREQV